ncbi:hypothetical protein, partial [Shinella sp.]|uniref:hypothetical protein n=1 Tax=Shinella sp. TaxID=1870904 RepID=UPI0040361A8D
MARIPAVSVEDKMVRKPREPKPRNIVILCDGTGNELGGALTQHGRDIRISNVPKLFRIAQ